ncbi:DUF2017 domain-containing protein [Gephyromycinifex aptenodytis]|uniref:DUF2017 domain-containing protein n=1 Tax=Gephyromycinifex aptenodytis TaxID=2716227 RepID=UPI001446D9CD|nr:DUF2017 domain-containing protein [Gephyromycinifex aptenodytis]
MTHGFSCDGERIVARFEDAELELMSSLLRQTADLLEDAFAPQEPTSAETGSPDTFEEMMRAAGFVAGVPEVPADPAVARLLPDGHHDDPLAAAEFRRLTASSVRDRKLANLRAARAAVESAQDGLVDLDPDSAHCLLIGLNDIRLVLGERLGLRTDEDADELEAQLAGSPSDDPYLGLLLAYEFLTWLQETLATALLPD